MHQDHKVRIQLRKKPCYIQSVDLFNSLQLSVLTFSFRASRVMLKVLVSSYDQKGGYITLSTRALETIPGDMLRNSQLVYNGAEKRAVLHRESQEGAEACFPTSGENII